MSALLVLLIIIAVLVCGAILIISKQSDTFRITRSATFVAPADVVFAQVNRLRNWQAWSPWEHADPHSVSTFEGPDEGVNSVMTWAGDIKIGEGKMTILQSRPNEFVQLQLDFLKPMVATNIAEFTFTPEGEQTRVTWDMTGTNNTMGKLFFVLMNCDHMMGRQFENGFYNLRLIVEKKALS